MKIQIIQGQFSSKDAMDIITEMIQVKVKYHEGKIKPESNEEDIKFRETKIKNLQKELSALRTYLSEEREAVDLEGTVSIEI